MTIIGVELDETVK
jgi:hypothetical protein